MATCILARYDAVLILPTDRKFILIVTLQGRL